MSGREATEAQRQLLLELPGRIALERVDRVWLFGPREVNGRESGLVVLSLLPGDGLAAGLRQVLTWRYEAERVRGKLQRTDTLSEQGWAPADRIPRLIDGVLARLGDASENPIVESIRGDGRAWTAFLHSMGITRVDSGGGE